MRRLAVAGALALAAWWATPADAYVVEVTTSVSVQDAEDHGQLKAALQSAVDGVLNDAIAFTPTMIVLTHAMVVGDRLYIRILLADQEGEATFRDLQPTPETETTKTDLKI